MSNDEDMAKKVEKGLFPNAQGGSLYNHIAGKAVAFHEAAQPEFHTYTEQILANASAMADQFLEDGVRIVSGGTDNHLLLVDLRSINEDLTGKAAAKVLHRVGITLNFNAIPNDPRPPFRASGVRIGTPSATTQGMKEPEMVAIASLMTAALRDHENETALQSVEAKVRALAVAFPPYPEGFPGFVG